MLFITRGVPYDLPTSHLYPVITCCSFSYLTAVSGLFVSQLMIFTFFAFNSPPRPLTGCWRGQRNGLEHLSGSAKLRSTIPTPWQSYITTLTIFLRHGFQYSYKRYI